MPKLLTHVLLLRPQSGRILIGMVAGFTSERWPASGWNARPDNVGIRSHERIFDHYWPGFKEWCERIYQAVQSSEQLRTEREAIDNGEIY